MKKKKSIQFVLTKIYEDHPWIGKALKDVFLPRDVRVALVERGGEQFIPDGETIFEQGDSLILSHCITMKNSATISLFGSAP